MPEAKQNKRLLTDEEVNETTWKLAMKQAAQENAYRQSGKNPLAKPKQFTELERTHTLLEAQDAKTLKEVGEWLEQNTTAWQKMGLDGSTMIVFTLSAEYANKAIQALKQGKMLE